MKESKKAIFKQSVILAGVAGGLLLLSACSSTKVLDNNGDIPAPSLTPPENANQVVTQELQTQSIVSTPEQPVIIQTATNVPGFKEGVEGKVKYTVKKGDSLWRISKMFDVSVRELAAYNNMDINKGLRVGEILQIPPSGLASPRAIATTPTPAKHKKHTAKATPTSKKAKVATSSGNGASYIVKKGDSLKSVAKKNGITVKELLTANSSLTEDSKLKAGQKLKIPAKGEKAEKAAAVVNTKTSPVAQEKQADKALNDLINSDVIDTSKPADNKDQPVATTQTAAATPAAATTEQKPAAAAIPNYLPHTVKDGDTWQTISDMYGLSVEDLKKANDSITGEPKVGIIVNIPEE